MRMRRSAARPGAGLRHCRDGRPAQPHPSGRLPISTLPPAKLRLLTSGPGRLSQALGITRQRDNAQDLCSRASDLFIADDGSPAPDYSATPRINVTRAPLDEWRYLDHRQSLRLRQKTSPVNRFQRGIPLRNRLTRLCRGWPCVARSAINSAAIQFPMRPRFQWNIGRRSLPLGERTLVMGVLNVTPDSFSDGGRYPGPQAAIAHGLELLDQGADILDIGGESTRPGVPTASGQAPALAGAVSAQEEIDRVLPIIEAIRRERPHAILSIDTYKSTVARCALEAGAEIVNDVSGFTWDSAMAATVAATLAAPSSCTCAACLTSGAPCRPRRDIVSLVRQELRDRVSARSTRASLAGSIVLDPGFGFGKNFDENYSAARPASPSSTPSASPCSPRVSRKSFLGRTVAARLSPNRSATLAAPHLPQSADVGLLSDRAKIHPRIPTHCNETPQPWPPPWPPPSPEPTSSASMPSVPPSRPLPSPTPSSAPKAHSETAPLVFSAGALQSRALR